MSVAFRALLARLVLLVLVLGLAPGAQPAAAATTPDFVPGELLVKLPSATAGFAPARLTEQGVSPLRAIPELGLAIVSVPPEGSIATAAANLEASGAVEWAEPNYTFKLDQGPFYPNDPDYTIQAPYLKRMGAVEAWGVARGKAQVILAVLDTGIDINHKDLRDAIWTNPGEVRDGKDNDGNGFVDDINGWDFAAGRATIEDDYGHGTHVAGIAAATMDNATGMAGLAGGVTIMPVDVFGGGIGTYEDLIRALIYATDNGANVINMSLGASSYSRGEEMAVNYAVDHGVVVVAAAGNQARERVHYPAAHEKAIAVASTTAQDEPSYFTNRGTFVDVAAPGSMIWSTIPGDRYAYKQGTSMATPHVAGLAALILSRDPSLTPAAVREIIESTADDLGAPGYDIVFGHGRINAGQALSQTPAGAGDPRDTLPPLDVDLKGCRELLLNGDFEAGQVGWWGSGGVNVVGDIRYSGQHSIAFPGGPNATSTFSQTVTVPANATAGLIRFTFRILPEDGGYGPSPSMPYDDWFRADLVSVDGSRVIKLLETGNTADAAPALPWDRYIYRLEDDVLQALKADGEVSLVFTAQNDGDAGGTDFWLDAVRFCVLADEPPGDQVRTFLPLVWR